MHLQLQEEIDHEREGGELIGIYSKELPCCFIYCFRLLKFVELEIAEFLVT